MASSDDEERCTFCGKPRSEVYLIFKSQIEDVCICDECVRVMQKMLAEWRKNGRK